MFNYQTEHSNHRPFEFVCTLFTKIIHGNTFEFKRKLSFCAKKRRNKYVERFCTKSTVFITLLASPTNFLQAFNHMILTS